MAKRKQGVLPTGAPADDTSAGFSGSEVVKRYCHIDAFFKAVMQAGGGKDCSNEVASVSEVPQGQRSKGQEGDMLHTDFWDSEVLKSYFRLHPVWKDMEANGGKDCYKQVPIIPEVPKGEGLKGQYAESDEVRILEESRNQCLVGTNPPKPQNLRGRQKAKLTVSGQLDSGKFEFYIENIWRRLTTERKKAFTFVDSLWFSLYNKEPLKRKVLCWIQKKNIFTKKHVFVPIVQWGHWFLLILCHFDESPESTTNSRYMLLLDSLQEANSKQLVPRIRRFVFDIYKTEERCETKELINKIPLLIPQVPQQRNESACGHFVLYYIYQFIQSVDGHFNFYKGYPDFLKEDWFHPEEVECFIKCLDSISNNNSDS